MIVAMLVCFLERGGEAVAYRVRNGPNVMWPRASVLVTQANGVQRIFQGYAVDRSILNDPLAEGSVMLRIQTPGAGGPARIERATSADVIAWRRARDGLLAPEEKSEIPIERRRKALTNLRRVGRLGPQ